MLCVNDKQTSCWNLTYMTQAVIHFYGNTRTIQRANKLALNHLGPNCKLQSFLIGSLRKYLGSNAVLQENKNALVAHFNTGHTVFRQVQTVDLA